MHNANDPTFADVRIAPEPEWDACPLDWSLDQMQRARARIKQAREHFDSAQAMPIGAERDALLRKAWALAYYAAQTGDMLATTLENGGWWPVDHG